MTTQTPSADLPAIQRYKIGYQTHEWGERSSTPSGIRDDDGNWVRYTDHIAALTAQATSAEPSGAAQGAGITAVGGAPSDPMDWPLPCDVTVGHGTMCKGVSLRTLVSRMKVLYEMATGNNADVVANRTPEENTALAAAFRAKIAAAPQPAPPADSVLEDAARYRWLRDCNSGSLAVMQITGTGEDDWYILTEDDADAAIDAARKQGGSHDPR